MRVGARLDAIARSRARDDADADDGRHGARSTARWMRDRRRGASRRARAREWDGDAIWRRSARRTRGVTDDGRARDAQAASSRVMNHRSKKFHGNIHRRGEVSAKDAKKKEFGVGPVMLGFFCFVVIGSSVLQVLRSASSGALGT